METLTEQKNLYHPKQDLFLNLISAAAEKLKKKFPHDLITPPPETYNKIFAALDLLTLGKFELAFLTGLKVAAGKFSNSPDRGWGCILTCILDEISKKHSTQQSRPPGFDSSNLPKHYVPPDVYWGEKRQTTPRPVTKPKKRGRTRAGLSWILEIRWPHLWKSSQVIFFELVRRYQYTDRPGAFPWCQAGVKSLSKFTGYSIPQVVRALTQLERFKLIKRIVKGNNFQGASKYLVFLTPAMSGAFSRKSLHAKKHLYLKKRIPRIP